MAYEDLANREMDAAEESESQNEAAHHVARAQVWATLALVSAVRKRED